MANRGGAFAPVSAPRERRARAWHGWNDRRSLPVYPSPPAQGIPLRTLSLLGPNRTELMADDNIEQRVSAIIVEKLGVDEADVNADASFTNDLGADSLDTVELIMEFEKEFDMTIPDEDAEQIATVGDAVDYIAEKQGA